MLTRVDRTDDNQLRRSNKGGFVFDYRNRPGKLVERHVPMANVAGYDVTEAPT